VLSREDKVPKQKRALKDCYRRKSGHSQTCHVLLRGGRGSDHRYIKSSQREFETDGRNSGGGTRVRSEKRIKRKGPCREWGDLGKRGGKGCVELLPAYRLR